MESRCFSSKSTRCHYDITMSKRTRKAPYIEESANKNIIIHVKGINEGEKSSGSPRGGPDNEEEESDRKSLNQLMMNTNGEAAKVTAGVGRNPHSHSLSLSIGDHFTDEEKQHQLVTKQQEERAIVRMKSRSGMFGRYIKILSHLLKVKRDPCLVSRKRPILRLTT